MNEGTKKRLRLERNKMWTDEEVIRILDFMEENRKLEAPTAKVYYNKFIKLSGIDATWKLIRSKVRNLRISFQKADAWLNSTDAIEMEAIEGTEVVKKKLARTCAFYERLKPLFGNNTESVIQAYDKAYNSETSQSFAEIYEDIDMDSFVGMRSEEQHQQTQSNSSPQHTSSAASVAEDEEESNANHGILAEQEEMPTMNTTANYRKKRLKLSSIQATEKLKYSSPKTSIQQLTRMQMERTSMQKFKIECEQKRSEREMAIQERRLQLDEEKFKAELTWRKQEFELKKLRLEADERIAKYEIDMKYKNS